VRRVLIGVLLAAAGGCKCDPVKNCRIDDDCGGGAECVAGICVAASSSAGGAGGGGGSATAGGSAGGGGGGTAGGATAGGVPAVCTNVTCPTELGCIDDGGAADCVFALRNLRWSRPDAGEVYAPSGSIALIAEVDRALPANLQGMLRYELYVRDGGLLDAGLLVGNGLGQYVGGLPIGSLATRSYGLVTRTGSLSAETWFTIDGTAPSLAIQLQTAPTRPNNDWPDVAKWRRDERPLALVSSDEPLSAATLSAGGSDAGIVQQASFAACNVPGIDAGGCTAATCACFEIAIPALPFASLTRDFPLAATGRDVPGTTGTATGPTLQATRVRWEVPAGGAEVRGVAVGEGGRLYVGTRGGASTGALFAISPDGRVLWSNPVGAIEGSVAVGIVDAGLEYVFFAANTGGTTGAVMHATNADGGTVGTACGASLLSVTNSSPALALTPAGLGGTATFNNDGTAGRIMTFVPGQSCRYPGATSLPSTVVNMRPGVNLVMKGDVLYVPAADSNLRAFRRGSSAWDPDTQEMGYPVPVGSTASDVINGLAMRVGGSRLAGGGGAGIRQLFELPAANPVNVAWRSPAMGVAAVGVPAAGTAGYFHGSDTTPTQLRRVEFTGMNEVVLDAGTAGFVQTSPIVTEGGLVYWVGGDGTLLVTDEQLGSVLWSAGLGAGQVSGSPNLDCNRSGAGGVLYVPFSNGLLRSVLVDSRRLAGEWPKWQHDSQNSGNADWPLNLGCP